MGKFRRRTENRFNQALVCSRHIVASSQVDRLYNADQYGRAGIPFKKRFAAAYARDAKSLQGRRGRQPFCIQQGPQRIAFFVDGKRNGRFRHRTIGLTGYLRFVKKRKKVQRGVSGYFRVGFYKSGCVGGCKRHAGAAHRIPFAA